MAMRIPRFGGLNSLTKDREFFDRDVYTFQARELHLDAVRPLATRSSGLDYTDFLGAKKRKPFGLPLQIGVRGFEPPTF